jgi:pimeloyl-ACP methyl ester carboxylesterase
VDAIDTTSVLERANASSLFRIAARHWDARVAFDVGGVRYVLVVQNGAAGSFERVSADADGVGGACAVRVHGSSEAWDELLAPVPRARFDHLAVARPNPDGVAVEGDIVRDVGPYYQAIQEFVRVLREDRNGELPVREVADPDREFDTAVGRYVYVPIDGVKYRIYYEESGTGSVPLVMQHTAGADARQWRHVLEDPDYQRLFRMVAYDLPYHGRSLPPTSVRWWESEYRLTKDFLMKAVVAISHSLGLDRPVFMGCSVGGHLAPDLALSYPDEFRAVIGLNAGLKSDGAGNPEILESWHHPRVSDEFKAASMLDQTAPTSPEAYRRETTWIYSQGAPAALKGDVYYYSVDHDLTAEQARDIDTTKVDVYLLTGEYDFLATDRGTAELARNIDGCSFQVIPGLGHFGPSENPEDAKRALLPVFEAIVRGDKPSSARPVE